MKIVIASGIYPPDIGGPATYSRFIAREFIGKGIDVSLICYSDMKEDPTDKEDKFKLVRILRRGNPLVRYANYAWNLFKLAKGCDVIYAQGPLGAGLPALAVARLMRKKFIIKIVGDYAWEQGVNQFGVKDLIEEFQTKHYDAKTERIRKLQNFVVRRAYKVITPSEFLKKIVRGWGVEEKKIRVVYNAGPDVERMAKITPKTGLEGDILITAGRLEPWKGTVALVEVMPDLLQENPDFKLFVGGDGPLTEKLKATVKELNVEKNVYLPGRVQYDELMHYYKASMIFILNTGYEGLPHVTLEAMACDLPVVTTNVCGNPEVIKDGYNGFLIEYNNKEQLKKAILEIWRNKALREKFISNSKEMLKNFTHERMINDTIKVLSS